MQTWVRNVPDVEIEVINFANLEDWVGISHDWARFVRLPFKMQSELVKTSVLERHGGLFLDADMILSKDIFAWIREDAPEADELCCFGRSVYPYLSFMLAKRAENPVLWFCARVQRERLARLPRVDTEGAYAPKWDFLGHSVYVEALKNKALRAFYHSYDAEASRFLLESALYGAEKNSKERYLKFYFGVDESAADCPDIAGLVAQAPLGVISLHNSWTPQGYKAMNPEETLRSPCRLSQVLRHCLGIQGGENDPAIADVANRTMRVDSPELAGWL